MYGRLLAVGATVGGAEEVCAAGGAVMGKDAATVGADLCAGKEFDLAARAGKGEFQFAGGAVFDLVAAFDVFFHGCATAGAEGSPAGRARWVADVDAGSAVGAGRGLPGVWQRVGEMFWLAFGSSLRGPGTAVKDKAAMRADLVVWGDIAVTAGAAQDPGLAAGRASGVVGADERAAVGAQVGVAVCAQVGIGFDGLVAAGAVRHCQSPFFLGW